jgi:Ser/Thr protein kinase RdoA (MazF antagonist)
VSLTKFLKKQPRNTLDFGLCHADLVISNVRLTDEGEIALFDFGNAMVIWRAFELAVVYWSLANRFENIQDKLWGAFLQGYELNRALPEAFYDNLYAMLVLRQIGFLGGNCATLPLRLGTEPFESGFIAKGIERLRGLVERSGIMK